MSSIESVTASVSSSISLNGLDSINRQLANLPAILDRQTLYDLANGEYDITLEEYTDMNSYRAAMNSLYGNYSANRFPSMLNSILGKGNQNNNNVSAREFIDIMRKRGLSNGSAIGLYTALKTYSINSSLIGNNNSFISAKI